LAIDLGWRLAFSNQHELCPSCAAKRGSGLAWFLVDQVLEDLPHAQWVFTIPKMPRPLDAVTLAAGDHQAVEALSRYMMRPPRLKLLPGENQVLHVPDGSGDDPGSAKPSRLDALDYVARVLLQIPPPRKHLVHTVASNAARESVAESRPLSIPSSAPTESQSAHANHECPAEICITYPPHPLFRR
jgi:hypothetical protein